jgi:hypothetical protein
MASSPARSSSSMSLSPSNPLSGEITAEELGEIITDPEMTTLIAQTFDDDITGTLLLRYYLSLSESIERQRRETRRLVNERLELYHYAINMDRFQRMMRPVVGTYRERQLDLLDRSTRPPLSPLFDSSPPSSAYMNPTTMTSDGSPITVNIEPQGISEEVPHPSSSPNTSTSHDNDISTLTDEQPRTVEITSMNAINEEDSATSEDSMIPLYTNDDRTESGPSVTFYTANSELGSQQNPIDVDRLFIRTDTPHPAINTRRRTRSNPINDRQTTRLTSNSTSSLPLSYCRICGLHGHLPDGCVMMGPFLCSHCREVGHGARNCPERQAEERRYQREEESRYRPDLQFCLVCSQQGHSIDRCFALQYPSQ